MIEILYVIVNILLYLLRCSIFLRVYQLLLGCRKEAFYTRIMIIGMTRLALTGSDPISVQHPVERLAAILTPTVRMKQFRAQPFVKC